jgi:hypothetical protein
VLDRGGRFSREAVIEELSSLPFRSLIVAGGPGFAPDADSLCLRFPSLRVLRFARQENPGTMIGACMRELSERRVLVLQSDQRIHKVGFGNLLIERLVASETLCLIPALANDHGEILPSLVAPSIEGSKFKPIPALPAREGDPSLYPFDYVGAYHREAFLSIGGFDEGIANPYWQKLEFGLRAWLWGHDIRYAPGYKCVYETEPPHEDASSDASYRYLHLRYLASGARPGRVYLPWIGLLRYMLDTGLGIGRAFAEFAEARAWLAPRAGLWKRDIAKLIDAWGETR